MKNYVTLNSVRECFGMAIANSFANRVANLGGVPCVVLSDEQMRYYRKWLEARRAHSFGELGAFDCLVDKSTNKEE